MSYPCKKATTTPNSATASTKAAKINAEKVVRQELSNKDKQLDLVKSMLGEAKLN